jgi:hypothetical protein
VTGWWRRWLGGGDGPPTSAAKGESDAARASPVRPPAPPSPNPASASPGQQVSQRVRDALGVARVGDRSGRRPAQAQVLIDLAQQQQATVTAQVPAAEVGLDDATSEPPEIDLGIRTLWHRQSSVVIGVRVLCQRASARGCRPTCGEKSGLGQHPARALQTPAVNRHNPAFFVVQELP